MHSKRCPNFRREWEKFYCRPIPKTTDDPSGFKSAIDRVGTKTNSIFRSQWNIQ